MPCMHYLVLKVPTWHEVEQADTSLIALHLSKSSNFDQFYDLLVALLKVHKKYDRLADRVGIDEQTFLDELSIIRVRMEQMSLVQPTGGRRPLKKTPSIDPAMSSRQSRPLPPPPPPARQKVTKKCSLPPPPMPTALQGNQRIPTKTPVSIPPSEQVIFAIYADDISSLLLDY